MKMVWAIWIIMAFSINGDVEIQTTLAEIHCPIQCTFKCASWG